MGDSYNDPQRNGRNFQNPRDSGRPGFRGGRGPGNREGGGFRIRLSENEMRSARALQEAFNLRSTVAVLGFALRTLGEMLEQGKLDEFLTTYREQGPRTNNKKTQDNRFNDQKNFPSKEKPNPFERPAKPEQTQESEEAIESKDEENSIEIQSQESDNSVSEESQTNSKEEEKVEQTSQQNETNPE